MTKTYTYDIYGETTYLERSDELEEFPTRSIEYTADEKELTHALSKIVYKEYFNLDDLKYKENTVQLGLQAFIYNDDIVEKLCEIYDEQLREYFKASALRYCQDA